MEATARICGSLEGKEAERSQPSSRREARQNGGATFRVLDRLLLPFSPRSTVSATRAAQALDVSVRTVARMCESGELKAFKIRGGKSSSPWRINYESLVAHVERIHKEHGLAKRF